MRHNEYAFSLLIYTTKQWVGYNSHMYSFIAQMNALSYIYDYDENDFDEVRLLSETDEDNEILTRLKFESHDKDQLHILMPITKVYSGE